MEKENKKGQELRETRGITLVVLIVTVIVMMVLVGVTVSIVINSGLIGKAAEAGEEWKEAQGEEGNLSNITIGETEYNSINEYIEAQGLETGGSGTGGGGTLPVVRAGVKVIAKSTYTSGNYTAVIPEGFTVSGKTGENTISEGLVIYLIQDKTNEQIAAIDWENDTTLQTTYDQFVWIPIKNTTSETEQDINDMYICQGKTTTNGDCNISLDSTGEAICTTTGHNTDNKNQLMAGRLHAITSQVYKQGLNNTREPDTVNNSDNLSSIAPIEKILGIDYTNLSQFKEDLQEEYDEIVKSVYNNQGFYVGRYETSNMVNTDTNITVKIVAGTQSGIGNISWYRMYAQQKNYANNKGIQNDAGSAMIQGAAYDQIMFFVDGTIDGTGENTFNIKTASALRSGEGSIESTGYDIDDKVKNIFDLEGNVVIWTTTAYSTNARVNRGGDYNTSSSAWTHSSILNGYVSQPNNGAANRGSLQQLYIK